ncbi:MAG: MFS transporter, partial [Flavobacterium sp.]|nr:MFS transporter [Flavobacterium sp.]
RVPFWVSILMVFVSYLIRTNMEESPVFAKAKSEGTTSKNPIQESFGNKYNLKFVLLALFGATMGQGVVWYTGQFYAMNFMKTVMNIDSSQVDTLLGIALILGIPFFIFFGWLSDKIGRKYIMMGGMLLAVVFYRPIYKSMYATTNVDNKTEIIGKTEVLAELKQHEGNAIDSVCTISTSYSDGTKRLQIKTVKLENGKVILIDGKPKVETKTTVTINSSDQWMLIFLVFIQVLFVTMVYGPIAAFLVEMFPAKIRYTSMSLPYHVGNGIFGGLLPAISTYFVTHAKEEGDPEFYLDGLWYPIVIASVCFAIGMIYIKNNTKNKHI